MGPRRVGRVGAVLILMVWAGPGYSAVSPPYNIIDLGTLGGSSSYATSINDLGQVVGSSYTTTGDGHGFLWQNGAMTDIGILSTPTAINNSGQVVGYDQYYSHGTTAYSWKNGVLSFLGFGIALDINDSDKIVGTELNKDLYMLTVATLWDGNGETILGMLPNHTGPSIATSINKQGQIVGYSWQEGLCQAFLWEDGTMTALGGGLMTADNINDAGQIIGMLAGGESYHEHAYLLDDGTLTDLGVGYARAINNAGQIVGYQGGYQEEESTAILWQNGVVYDLIDLIANDTGWELRRAEDINNLGQIVGNGYINGEYHAFLLDPIPEPAAILLLGLGSFVLLKRRRRR